MAFQHDKKPSCFRCPKRPPSNRSAPQTLITPNLFASFFYRSTVANGGVIMFVVGRFIDRGN